MFTPVSNRRSLAVDPRRRCSFRQKLSRCYLAQPSTLDLLIKEHVKSVDGRLFIVLIKIESSREPWDQKTQSVPGGPWTEQSVPVKQNARRHPRRRTQRVIAHLRHVDRIFLCLSLRLSVSFQNQPVEYLCRLIPRTPSGSTSISED